MAGLLQTLRDGFDDADLTDLWTVAGDATAAGGVATLRTTTGNASLTSKDVYQFGGTGGVYDTYFYAKVTPTPATAAGPATTMTGIKVIDTVNLGYMYLYISAGNLYRRRATYTGSVATTLVAAYNATTMRYLRIRASSTTANYEYSADAVTWTSAGTYSIAWNGGNDSARAALVLERGDTVTTYETAFDDVNGGTGPPAYTGTGTLSGAGSLTARGSAYVPVTYAGKAGLSGTGALTASGYGTVNFSGRATLSGTATMAATAPMQNIEADAVLSGAAAMSAAGFRYVAPPPVDAGDTFFETVTSPRITRTRSVHGPADVIALTGNVHHFD